MLPSTNVAIRFLTRNDLGLLEAPDDWPTAVLIVNGVATATNVVVNIESTGKYKASWSNGAWSHGDVLQLEVTVAYDSQTYVTIVWDGEINTANSGAEFAKIAAINTQS
ncbi:hypothetical protein [Novipirellula artificiosorum]|uniref:Uncharacterized protein n=1 Tax=Novipirellula artificiosorum TaxID=2528016 RepID=A0A5C6DT15_9BACT|nr:hypothetical protein [Novipirellula artificiosorum]TWU38641.1 hypothetical protein Poly41_31180 [Novipirellula artificiosorum]